MPQPKINVGFLFLLSGKRGGGAGNAYAHVTYTQRGTESVSEMGIRNSFVINSIINYEHRHRNYVCQRSR